MSYEVELYQQVILEHNQNPRNFYKMTQENQHSCDGRNPLCGDELALYVQILEGKIQKISFYGVWVCHIESQCLYDDVECPRADLVRGSSSI